MLFNVRQFRKSLRSFERLVASQLKGSSCCSGVTLAQCHTILEIEAQGEPTLNELAQSLGLDKSTLSRTIDGLVNIGLVERATHPDDRRSIRLSLTEQGRRTCDRINAQNDAFYTRILARIEPEGLPAVLQAFETLVRAMADDGDAGNTGCAIAD